MNDTARDPQTLDEEIRDLANYLAGIPPSLRATGAFASYESRLTMLQQELAVSRLRSLLNLSDGLAPPRRHAPASSLSDELRDSLGMVRELEKRHTRIALFQNRATFVIQLAAMSISVLASVLALLQPWFSLVLGMAISVILALAVLLRLPERFRSEQQVIDRLGNIRMELEALVAGDADSAGVKYSLDRLTRLLGDHRPQAHA